MVFLELRRDSRVTTGNSGCLLCWPRQVQSSIRVAKPATLPSPSDQACANDSWLLLTHCWPWSGPPDLLDVPQPGTMACVVIFSMVLQTCSFHTVARTFFLNVSCIRPFKEFESSYERDLGEGNGNPFQYSCLDNSKDRGAWWATVFTGL